MHIGAFPGLRRKRLIRATFPRFGSPDRRVKRRLRESVQGFRSLLFRRKCLNVVGERVKGEKTVSPFTIPAVPQRNRCCALRSPPGPQPAVGSTRPYSSHPWDSPLRGQRKRCSKLLQAILSCLDSPLSAIPGGQPLSSGLRFTDFSGHQGIAAYHVVSETYPQRHENLPGAELLPANDVMPTTCSPPRSW